MLFGWLKKRKLAEEAKKQEKQRIQEEALQKAREESYAYTDNVQTFYRICDMVRSLPKERKIVVVQRNGIFQDDSDRNWWYLKTAREMARQHRLNGATWISFCNYSLYAFYMPTKIDDNFRQALEDFSRGGYHIQRIRYYNLEY